MIALEILYCALIMVSLVNSILLIWLGLTVLLNAERRDWGIGLAVGGLFAGGAVFIGQSAVLTESRIDIGPQLNVWWPLVWTGLVITPLAWYVAMLWHVGYWKEIKSALRRRHRFLLAFCLALLLLLAGLLVIARPLPFTITGMHLDLSAKPACFGIPLIVLIYPPFTLLCMSLSLYALLRPGPIKREISSPARQRARPWIITASLALLEVSLVVVGLLIWILLHYTPNTFRLVFDQLTLYFFWLDLAVCLLITVAVISLGQAIVAYEIFTGRTLPTFGLRRQWHYALVLAVGYGAVVGIGEAISISSAYVLILATGIVAATFAFFGWRSFQERERYMRNLRPFVTSEHFYDALLAMNPQTAPEGAASSFAALTHDLLGAKAACLVPTGSLSSLVSAPLVYPAGKDPAMNLKEIAAKCKEPTAMVFPVDPAKYCGAIWAIPLWSNRGLMGVFFLGEKSDRGLYSQEEIEIARLSGERLLDTIAGANLAQRLMALQRQRFIENQVIDQQSRRTLHDEILPSLHAAMLNLGAKADGDKKEEALAQLAEVHRRISALLREMPSGAASQVGKLGLIPALRQMVEMEFRQDFTGIDWQIDAEAEKQASSIPALTGDVIFYAAKEAIRNAARHGRGDDVGRALHLRISAAWRDGLELQIADDGIGLEPKPEPLPTGGQGLSLHSTMMAVIGGLLTTDDKPGIGTTMTIFLPQSSWQTG